MNYQLSFNLENVAATDNAVIYTGQSNTLTIRIKNTGLVWNVVADAKEPIDEDALISTAPICTVLYLDQVSF
jgi:hypothetical protein